MEENIRQAVNEDFTVGFPIQVQSLDEMENGSNKIESSYNVEKGIPKTALKAEEVIAYLWFVVMVLLFLWFFVSRVAFGYSLKSCQTVTDGRLGQILSQCGQLMKRKKVPELIWYEQANTPALWGAWKPKILISSSVAEMEQQEIYNMFLHELAHEKRKDIWMNYLLLALLCIHWFNPFLLYCFKLIRQDMELAADELAVFRLHPKEQLGYGKTLLMMAGDTKHLQDKNYLRERYFPLQGLKMANGKKNMAKRIRMIKNIQKFMGKRRVITFSCGVILLVLGAVLLTDAKTVQIKDVPPVPVEEDRMETFEDSRQKTEVSGNEEVFKHQEDESRLPAEKEYLVQVKEGYIYSEIYEASFDSYVASLEEPYIMYHVKKGNDYGFMNSYGDVAGEIIYDWSGSFNDGIGAVKKGEKWAAIDGNGILIRGKDPFLFDEVGYPENGMLPVKVGDKWGILCADGHILGSTGDGLEGICYDSVGYSSGWSIIFLIQSENQYAFLDTDGSIVGNQWFSHLSYMSKSGATCIVDDESGDSIILKRDGSEIKVPDGWYFAGPYYVFREGYAEVHNDKWKFNLISENGDLISILPFDKVNSFYFGSAVVDINGKKGILDTDGSIWGGEENVIYDEARPIISHTEAGIVSRYAMVRMGDKWGVMDKEGSILGGDGICYDEVSPAFYDGYVAVRLGDRMGFLGMDGTLLNEELIYCYEYMAHNGLYYFSLTHFSEGLAAVPDKNMLLGYIKTDGTMLYEENPYRFHEAGSFQNGYAVVQTDSGYGVIDSEGIEVLPPIYKDIRIGGTRQEETTFFVTEDGNLWGVVTAKPVIN